MPPTPHTSPDPARIPGVTRLARGTAVAGLAVALAAVGPVPLALAADSATAPVPVSTPKSAHDKLGSADAALLARAKATGAKNVTMMIATAPGQTGRVSEELNAVKGGSVGRTYDKLGYVRATVPTGRADSAIAAAAKLSSVKAIDLRRQVRLDDTEPAPAAPGTEVVDKSNGLSTRTSSDTYPGPGPDTPAANPYNPTAETGAVDFVKRHPEADGRGVTIGILDTGVDLASPALQKTSTGARKIVDWVTSTDPIVDGDATWRPMTTTVSGPNFTYDGQSWQAPAGSYGISTFHESATVGTGADGANGDVNRDGDTTDSWGVLYDAAAGTVTVDLDNDHDFTDDTPMKPYKDGYQIGYFGTDDPKTAISERQPFVVQIRKDVPMDPYGGDWVGKKADFVNIGIVGVDHGTHVAGIAAGNGLFGGSANGEAPGAQIVSSRACIFGPSCTNVALTEGMIDLVVNRGVDIVNMSIGGLFALNDGQDATSVLYTRLIDTYGVQLVISAGNDGPGANTIAFPGLADKAVSVAAGVSKETWAANYGSGVAKKYGLFPFSSRGPREDGGFTPTLTAPGSAVSTIPTWLKSDGYYDKETGWSAPPGYAMLNGTSMAAPQATGAGALLLSAAKERGIALKPAQLRTALTSTARHIKGVQAYEEGAGRIDVPAAWQAAEAGATAHDCTVDAPVDTVLAGQLTTPGHGTGLYDREGAPAAGQSKTYDVTVTRTSGPDGPVPHTLRLVNNKARTFSVEGPTTVDLPLNQPVTVKVKAAPRSPGIKSARLEIDDPATVGVDQQVLTTVVASAPLKYASTVSGSVQRNSARSYFVTVPAGATALQVAIGGLGKGSVTGLSVTDPFGTLAKDTNATVGVGGYADPQPGVWEIDAQSLPGSELLDNPYTIETTVLGAAFTPEPVTVSEVKSGTATGVSWTATNNYAPVEGTLQGGPLGSSLTARPSVAEGATKTTTVDVPADTTSFTVAIGGVDDPKTDLDLTVYDADGTAVGVSANGGSDESVTLTEPAAGTYTVEVYGYDVPAGGEAAYDYRDTYFSDTLGSVTSDGSAVRLGTGDTATVTADVTAASAAPPGRDLFGEVRLLSGRGTVAGTGTVTIGKVTP
ncbi:Tripeptidyl-peptidase II [Actinobacteria bacterium OK074]|nr:Tripeptidyl-peptidase II [Actinobacteria bacterium OK074]